MFVRDLAEHVAEVRGDGEVAAFVELLAGQAGPIAVDLAAVDRSAHDEHAGRVSVVGAASSVFTDRTPELRHGQQHDIVHAIAEIVVERAHSARKLPEAIGQLTLRTALVVVRVPAANVDKRDLDTHTGLDELRNLTQ